MIQTGQFYPDYLGNPDMNMAYIAKGFGLEAEVAQLPAQLRAARVGVAWADKPWVPQR
jgi:hypothetical protein